MPSKLSIFGNVPIQETKTKSIDSIPLYLRKYKEDASKEIAKWELNSEISNIDSSIIAMGSGLPYDSGSSVFFNNFSNITLGKYGYENRWQLNYASTDDFIATYFDGNLFFKRFSIDYKSGVIKMRNSDLRNGNVLNCNAQYQLSFGYSKDASYEDYSLYRHNFRSSHSNDLTKNSENNIDLYMWDRNNDLPESIGSRHVMRWNALGNEELVSGFRIDGGVNYDISDLDAEKNNFAISGKGVIYYNNKTNKYRYSENGNIFKNLGSSNGGAGFRAEETTYLNRCSLYKLPTPVNDPGDPTVFNASAIGVALYAHRRSRLKSISIGSGSSSGINYIIVYKTSSDDAISVQESYGNLGSPQAYYRWMGSNHGNKHIVKTNLSDYSSKNGTDVSNLYVNGYFYIALCRSEQLTGSDGSVYVDDVAHLSLVDSGVDSKASFLVHNAVTYFPGPLPPDGNRYYPNATAFAYTSNSDALTILPYIRVELEEVE